MSVFFCFFFKWDVKSSIWLSFVPILNNKKLLAEDRPQSINVSYLFILRETLIKKEGGHPFISSGKTVRDVALGHPTLSN